MTFNPTHEFQGLVLERREACGPGGRWYRDAEDREFVLPNELVTKILPKPEPGEVWKYIGEYVDNSDYNLVLIPDEVGPKFINSEGDTLRFAGDDLTKPNFIKILNADGTPA